MFLDKLKKYHFSLALLLSILSFIMFTKWWYAIVVDGTDELMYGFPFIYTCRGFHTSLSSQYFIAELIADFGIYLFFWFIILYLINRFIIQIKINRILSIIFNIISGLMICLFLFVMFLPENIFYQKRPFGIEKLDSGFNVIWQKKEHPNYEDYRDID